MLHSADFIKFNDGELLEISEALELSFKSLEENMNFIAARAQVALAVFYIMNFW